MWQILEEKGKEGAAKTKRKGTFGLCPKMHKKPSMLLEFRDI